MRRRPDVARRYRSWGFAGGLRVARKRRSAIRIRLVRSVIGTPLDQKATVRALGLKRLGDVVEKRDDAVVRGMIEKVKHVVEVEEVVGR
jgi:large subunit ribosomal protein L30